MRRPLVAATAAFALAAADAAVAFVDIRVPGVAISGG